MKKVVLHKAFTLVELLVVLGIALLLAALILPTVKTLLADRKTSQAAILVKNYLEAARARAIGKNRSVAVVLERISGRPADLNDDGVINMADTVTIGTQQRFQSATSQSFAVGARASQAADTNFIPYNTCIKLSMAEEPLPITSKTIPMLVNIQSQLVGVVPTGAPYSGADALLDADQLLIQGSFPPGEERTFSVTPTFTTPPGLTNGDIYPILGDYLVAGNEISFGDSSQRFTITAPRFSSVHEAYDIANPQPRIWFSISNELGATTRNEQSIRAYSSINLPADTSIPTTFRIFQKPKPIYTQTVQLPKGACIDLSLSGFANDKVGLSDYRARFASDWVIGGASGPPTPEELRPIYLVFSPDGSFSRVYANQMLGPQSVRIDAVDDVFLHVGRIDQVTMPYNASNVRDLASVVAAAANGTKQNLTDPSTYVLRLSPKSGAISTAPIRQFVPSPSDTLFDIIAKSRGGTYSSTVTGQ